MDKIEKGYYWVKFYNHNDRLVMFFNGKNFEGFKSDEFINDEIEDYEKLEQRLEAGQHETPANLPADIRKEMDRDMSDSAVPQGEIESLLNHWGNKYIIRRR